MPPIIAPSILAADPLNLKQELWKAEEAGADWHHIDVMDGHFVPNLTFGPQMVRAIKTVSRIPLDVHIMVSHPDLVASQYVQAGADILTFHLEATHHPHRVAQIIRHEGAKVGIAINPGTPVELLYDLLEDIDLVLIMSVNPGFGGQKFLRSSLGKVKKLVKEIRQRQLDSIIKIEVDGGINNETFKEVLEEGANALVVGTYFYGSKNTANTIKLLKGEINSV